MVRSSSGWRCTGRLLGPGRCPFARTKVRVAQHWLKHGARLRRFVEVDHGEFDQITEELELSLLAVMLVNRDGVIQPHRSYRVRLRPPVLGSSSNSSLTRRTCFTFASARVRRLKSTTVSLTIAVSSSHS